MINCPICNTPFNKKYSCVKSNHKCYISYYNSFNPEFHSKIHTLVVYSEYTYPYLKVTNTISISKLYEYSYSTKKYDYGQFITTAKLDPDLINYHYNKIIKLKAFL